MYVHKFQYDTSLHTVAAMSSPSLFDQISDPLTLAEAFGRVRRNGGGPGGDSETLMRFIASTPARFGQISAQLRSGHYRPGPVRRVSVPKPSGGRRQLAIPCVADRVVMTAVANLLSQLLEPEFEPESYGYRPGRSARQAVERVAFLRRSGYAWVVDGDIKAFFDNVPHHLLLPRLAPFVPDARLMELIADWLEAMGVEGRGLPQGSPLSPVLANFYLDAADEALTDGPVRLVRYADDFVLLARTEKEAEAALAKARTVFGALGLELHAEKTRVVPFDREFTFLGKLFVRSLVLDAPDVRPAEALPDLPEPPEPPVHRRIRGRDLPPPGPVRMDTEPGDAGALDARRPSDAPAARLRPLYVHEAGRRLSTEGHAFIVVEDGRQLLVLPPAQVDRIELGRHVVLDDAAARLAMAEGVPIAYVDGHGSTMGRLQPVFARSHGRLHLAQAALALDPARRFAMARSIVANRIASQRAVLKRLDSRRKLPQIAEAVEQLKRLRNRVAEALDVTTVQDAMALEAAAGRLYWPTLGACMLHGLAFRHRTRQPAGDPPNVVLNWLSWLLARDLGALAERHGLHTGFGCLHMEREDGDPLVYDLMEAFRAPLTEGLTVYLFNNQILRADQFLDNGGDGFQIAAEGRRRLVRAWEHWLEKLDRPVKSRRTGDETSWRGLMEEEMLAFAAHVRGHEVFSPYRLDY